jgi:drug/metabolite transporter (DMT)-like permease
MAERIRCAYAESMGRRAWTMLLTLGAIWGASYMFIKIGLRDLSPGAIAWLRIALAAAILVALARLRGALGGFAGKGLILVVLGAVQAAGPFLLIGAGEQEISSSLAGILVTSAPLWTALLAIWIDHEERSQGMRLVGLGLGVAGVAVLLGVDVGGSGNELLGAGAILLAGLGYAVGGFIAKRQLADLPPLGTAAWVMVASTVLLLPIAIAGAPAEAPGVGPLAAIVALGVVGTGVAFAIFYDLIASVGPARAFIVTYLAPGFAVVYGATLLDEEITIATIAGLGLILVGSWLAAEGRVPSALRRRPQLGGDVVAGAAGPLAEPVEDGDHALGPEPLEPLERPARVVEAEPHRGVDVTRRRHPLVGCEAPLVDELSDDALEDRSPRIVHRRRRIPR